MPDHDLIYYHVIDQFDGDFIIEMSFIWVHEIDFAWIPFSDGKQS